MAKQQINDLFHRFDINKLGMCSEDQLRSLLTAIKIPEIDVLAVLAHVKKSQNGLIHFGEFLDSLFGEDVPYHQQALHAEAQKAEDQYFTNEDQGHSQKSLTFQQAEGDARTRHMEHRDGGILQCGSFTAEAGEESCSSCSEEASSHARDDEAQSQEIVTCKHVPEDRYAKWNSRKASRKSRGSLNSGKFLSELHEVPDDIDLRYDFLVIGKAAAHLHNALEPDDDKDSLQPLSLICKCAQAPADISLQHLEHWLLSSERHAVGAKTAKIRFHICGGSKDEVFKAENVMQAYSTAAIFVLSLPPPAHAEAEPKSAQRSLDKQMSVLEKKADQHFNQPAPLLASLACLLIFGERPLPVRVVRFAEEHGLLVACLPGNPDLRLLLARLASLLPAAAKVKERSLAEYTHSSFGDALEPAVCKDLLGEREEDDDDDFSNGMPSRSTSTKSEDVKRAISIEVQALRDMGVLK